MSRIFFERARSGFRTVRGESNVKWIEDVRKRKMTLAFGQGTVHGAQYAVDSWGIGEFDI